MFRLIILSFSLPAIFSCGSVQNKKEPDKNTGKEVPVDDTLKYNGLKGTWIRQNRQGFTLIEIKDTAHVSYYQLIDRKADIDTITVDRYWYYNSKAKLGYWDSSTIWISTGMYRFDYKLKGDTLIEFDKMGEQGRLIKVYTDEEKQEMDEL